MLFLTHLVAAGLVATRTRLSPIWLVVGAALPDVVDKPLAMAGLVEVFHSVGHSVFLGVLLVPAALLGPRIAAVTVGWGSHLLLDAVHVVLNGRPWDVLSLGWPVTISPEPLGIPPGDFFFYYLGTPSFLLEVVFWLALLAVLGRRLRATAPTGTAE